MAAPVSTAPTNGASHISPPVGARLLIIDEQPGIRFLLARHLRARGYDVHVAESGESALTRLRRERFAVALCDFHLPGMGGLEVVDRAAELDPDLAFIMVSAVLDPEAEVAAALRGVRDFLLKPLEFEPLLGVLDAALQRRASALELRAGRGDGPLAPDSPRHELAEARREERAMRALTVTIAETLINAMEAKDQYLRGHSQRVAELAAAIAEDLGVDVDIVESIRLAGRLHDVGKIGIREDVLNKPSSLTPDEFEHVKQHVRIGVEILAPLQHMGVALEYVHDHHEHWDGGGYPRGRAGEQISIGGRILAAADAFDALTSSRAYRSPMTAEETLTHLGDNARGSLLDPRIYEALVRVVRRRQLLTYIEAPKPS